MKADLPIHLRFDRTNHHKEQDLHLMVALPLDVYSSLLWSSVEDCQLMNGKQSRTTEIETKSGQTLGKEDIKMVFYCMSTKQHKISTW